MAKYQITHLGLGQETNAVSHDRVRSTLKKNVLRIMEEVTMKNCGIYFEKQNQKWFRLWTAIGLEAKTMLVILSTNLISLSI